MSLRTKRQLIAQDVVSAINAGGVEGGPHGHLKAQIKRVGVELNRRKAQKFTRKLMDGLAASPEDVPQLEALVVLGLAFPEVMRKNHIILSQEGRRLGQLMEKGGRQDRAREVFELLCERYPEDRTLELELAGVVRRSGKTDELIERYMERAQGYYTKGEFDQAMPWLHQILSLDRSRTDVVSMISEIRRDQTSRRDTSRSNRRFLVSFLLIGSVIGAMGFREWKIHQQSEALPPADRTDLGSMAQRIQALEGLVEDHTLWLGRSRVDRELAELRDIGDAIREEAAEALVAERQAFEARLQRANELRLEGLQAADLGRWAEAQTRFQEALETAPAGWEHGAALRKDIQAIQDMEGSR